MKTLFTSILFAVFCIYQARAGTSMGADITWRHLDNDTLNISITVYIDCNSNGSYDSIITVTNACGSASYSLKGSKSIGTDVTPVCKSTCTRCSNSSCSDTKFGITKAVISARVRLDKSKCCEWKIGYGNVSRTANITNGGASDNIYIEAFVNICMPGNNSPVFGSDPLFTACKNQCTIYDPKVSTADTSVNGARDSLVVTFTDAFKYAGGKISYNTGFSAREPLSYFGAPDENTEWEPNCGGFHLDNHTGVVRFKPTDDEVGIVVLKVEKWRKNSSGFPIKIAETRREMEVNVIDSCVNTKVPMIDGSSFTICAGQEICKKIGTWDLDKDDTTHLKLIALDLPPASITKGSGKWANLTFCWKPTVADVRTAPYTISFEVTDSACPYPGVNRASYNIYVKDSVTPIEFTVDTVGPATYRFIPSDTSTIKSYSWNFGNGVTSTEKSPIYEYPKEGSFKVWLVATHNSGCQTNDSLTLKVIRCPGNNHPKIFVDTGSQVNNYVCLGEKVVIDLSTFDPDSLRDSVFISMDPVPGVVFTIDSSSKMQKARIIINQVASNANLYVKARDNYACSYADSIRIGIGILKAPNAAFTYMNPYGSTFNFNASDSNKNNSYLWDFGDGNTSNAFDPTHTYKADGIYNVKLVIDNGTCTDTSIRTLSFKTCLSNIDPVLQDANNQYIHNFCAGVNNCIPIVATDIDANDILNLTADSQYTNSWIQYTASTSPLNAEFCWNPSASLVGSSPHRIKVYVNDGYHSCGRDSIEYQINVVSGLDASFNVSSGTGPREFKFIPDDTLGLDYTWNFGDGSSSYDKYPVHTYTSDGTYNVKLTIMTTQYCGDEKTMSISVISTGLNNDKSSGNTWTVYPNPVAGDKLIIESANVLIGSVDIILYDLNGRKVCSEKKVKDQRTELNLPEGLSQGQYMLHIVGTETWKTAVMVR